MASALYWRFLVGMCELQLLPAPWVPRGVVPQAWWWRRAAFHLNVVLLI
ncbi:hypothetical protein E2C01_080682 [Portunus trituberculatus]|uniref:Uncharacterized protein n=1 Tax=Portunus trituberculatus TaxID=210409 RepID=A0A5B7IU21_PORTR|nr:hypothetical protein [Portunus trituberculatus]